MTCAGGEPEPPRDRDGPLEHRAKAPAFQWYPGDHHRDTALKACCFEARALWREMLDLMHDGEPYGHLTAGGVPIEPRQLARIVGVQLVQARRWLAELESRKVFSRTESGVIYSRRMVHDESIRTVRRAAGKKGGNPVLLNQNDKQKPTPAVAVAVAVAPAVAPSPSPSTADLLRSLAKALPTDVDRLALNELVGKVPEPLRWLSEMAAALNAMAGHARLTPAQLGEALRDFVGNGDLERPSFSRFRGYLRNASNPPPARRGNARARAPDPAARSRSKPTESDAEVRWQT